MEGVETISDVIDVIDGYRVLKPQNKGTVFIRTPQGANVSIKPEVIKEIAQRLENNKEYKNIFF